MSCCAHNLEIALDESDIPLAFVAQASHLGVIELHVGRSSCVSYNPDVHEHLQNKVYEKQHPTICQH